MVRGLVSLVLVAMTGLLLAQMDSSIGGKSVGQRHDSVFDAGKALYLYSGVD